MSMSSKISLEIKDNLLQCLKSGLRLKMQLSQSPEIKTEPDIEIDDDFARVVAEDSQNQQTASNLEKKLNLKRKKKSDSAGSPTVVMTKVSRGNNSRETDEHDIFGEFVAAEMRKIKDPFVHARTRLFIHNLLFEARFGQSTTSTTPGYINQMFRETQTELIECKPLACVHDPEEVAK